jgi:hypothetical protein
VGRLDDSAARAEVMDQHALLLVVYLATSSFALAYRA